MDAGGVGGRDFCCHAHGNGNCYGESEKSGYLTEEGEMYRSMPGVIWPVRYSDVESLERDLFHVNEGIPNFNPWDQKGLPLLTLQTSVVVSLVL